MRLKIYQLQVVAGILLATLMECLLLTTGSNLPKGIEETLQGASFLFCCVGIMTGGRELRSAFDLFGRDKSLARRDAAYMRARAQLQITSIGAVAAISVVAARLYGINEAIPLVGAVILGLSLPLINRWSGWAGPDRS